jgi:pimeloyl-ACP methyl ester carboxylesterase
VGLFIYYIILDKLSDHFNIVAIEMPNLNGLKTRSMCSNDVVLTSIYNVLRKLNIYDEIYLMGHSFGTIIISSMLNYQNMHSKYHKISGVVLMDPVCFYHRLTRAHILSLCDYPIYKKLYPGQNEFITMFIYYMIIHSYDNQMATHRFANNGALSVFRNHKIKGMVILGEDDLSIDAKNLYPYIKENFKNLEILMTKGHKHGDFLYKDTDKIIQNIINHIN